MWAVATAQTNYGLVACSDTTNLCSSCYNMYAHMQWWIVFTPEFQVCVVGFGFLVCLRVEFSQTTANQITIVLISSPLTLLVALWGMTTEQTLQLMASCGNPTGSARFNSREIFFRASEEFSEF